MRNSSQGKLTTTTCPILATLPMRLLNRLSLNESLSPLKFPFDRNSRAFPALLGSGYASLLMNHCMRSQFLPLSAPMATDGIICNSCSTGEPQDLCLRLAVFFFLSWRQVHVVFLELSSVCHGPQGRPAASSVLLPPDSKQQERAGECRQDPTREHALCHSLQC